MAAKTWEQDFRYPAIQASIEEIRSAGLTDPLEYAGSYCVPIADKPAVGWTPGKIYLVFLVVGFGGLAGGAFLATVAEDNEGPQSALILAAAVVSSLTGFACFFVPSKLDKRIIRWLIGERAQHLFDRAGGARGLLAAELSRPDQQVQLSIDGDDHVLVYADPAAGELLIEGTGARYRIRSSDLKYIARFEFMNYVGAEIRCRINDEADLHVAIARVSLLLELTRQLPFLGFLRKRIRNRVLETCACVEVPDIPDASPDEQQAET